MKKIKNSIIFFLLFYIASTSLSQVVITDFEGNEYKTIEIAGQIWMAENLNSIIDTNGDTIESYCFYNDSTYCKKYGRLYPWTALNTTDTDNMQNSICPDGWHIPNDKEWDIIIESLGGFEEAGKKLKNEEYPFFNIQYGGNYNTLVKIFSYIDDHAYFWTSTRFSNSAAWMRQIGLNNKNINRSTVPVIYAFSIRCVKD